MITSCPVGRQIFQDTCSKKVIEKGTARFAHASKLHLTLW